MFDQTFYSPEIMNDWKIFHDVVDAEETIFAVPLPSGITVTIFKNLERSWQEYLKELDKEVPKEKRRDIVLDGLRKYFQWEIAKQKELEDAYTESKTKKGTYAERRRIAELLEIVDELHKDTQKKGKHFENQALTLDWIDPLCHLKLIEEEGFENFLKHYWQLAIL